MLRCFNSFAICAISICLFATLGRSQVEATVRLPRLMRASQAEAADDPAKKEHKSDAEILKKQEPVPTAPQNSRSGSLLPKSSTPKPAPSAHLKEPSLAKSNHKAVDGLGKDGLGGMGHPSVSVAVPHAENTASGKSVHHPVTDAKDHGSEDEPEHHLHHTHHEDPCAKAGSPEKQEQCKEKRKHLLVGTPAH